MITIKKIIFLVLFLFVNIFVVFAKIYDRVLINKVFIIDPGHGGRDSGTFYKDIYEKDINLDISLKLKNALLKKGASVYMTRDFDCDLSSPNSKRRKKSDFDNRVDYINEYEDGIYISIHINYLSDARYFGPQVFYTKGNEALADSIQKSLNKHLKTDRYSKSMDNKYYMYDKLKIPGVLIECGFLSNKNDRNNLIDENYQKKIVNYIVEGIINYY